MRQIRAWLKTLLTPAPDPRQSPMFAFQHHQDLLAKVQTALTGIRATREQLEAKVSGVNEEMSQLEAQARQAMSEGTEDRALMALRRRRMAIAELEALGDQVRQVEGEEYRLHLVEHRLAAQIEAVRTRKEVLEARYTAAEAQARIGEILTGASDEPGGLGATIELAQERADQMQARVSAIEDLIKAGALDPSDDPMSGDLEQVQLDAAVLSDFEALRKSMGGSQYPGPSPCV